MKLVKTPLIGVAMAGGMFITSPLQVASGQWCTVITDPAPLNTNAASDSGGDMQPQLTTDGQGNWVAVWDSYDDLGGTIGTDFDILVSRSTDNAATWTDPAPLNTNAASDSG
ncbi:MAG: exo-alpha-sialidase, partial [Planctomycetes bacterium]|nr:exo-alpha-sialidase [Planctomycetota bacterium]